MDWIYQGEVMKWMDFFSRVVKNIQLLAVLFLVVGFLTACGMGYFLPEPKYTVSGEVVDEDGEFLPEISMKFTGSRIRDTFLETDEEGGWKAVDLQGKVVIEPIHDDYSFSPPRRSVTVEDDGKRDLDFQGGLITYHLTLEANPRDAGTVMGEGEYRRATQVRIQALENSWNYKFVNWTRGEEIISEEASFYYMIPDEDVKLVANFKEKTIKEKEDFISGYVTITKGGPPLTGATVTGPSEDMGVVTDETGYFRFPVPEGYDDFFTLWVEKEAFARGKLQNISREIGNFMEMEIPVREALHSDWSLEPPVITINGIQPYEEVTGELKLEFEITGERPIYVFYVYFSGLQRSPQEGFFVDFVDTGRGEVEIDTSLYPNGKNFILVQAYDDNGNLTVKVVPVNVNNHPTAEEVPGDLNYFNAYSITLGDTLGYYALEQGDLSREITLPQDLPDWPEIEPITLKNVPTGITLYNHLEWDPVEGADGYRIYRSFDGYNYQLLSSTPETFITDFSPKLKPEREVEYYVEPYNSYGTSKGLYRWLLPLDHFNVSLQSPANGANNVPLNPTFSWKNQETFFQGTRNEWMRAYISYEYYFHLYDGTGWKVYDKKIEEKQTFSYPLLLNPGAVYSWDIYDADAFILYTMDEEGYSFAISIASDFGGSIDGENVFTTTPGEGS